MMIAGRLLIVWASQFMLMTFAHRFIDWSLILAHGAQPRQMPLPSFKQRRKYNQVLCAMQKSNILPR